MYRNAGLPSRWSHHVHSQVAYSSQYAGNNILGIVREQHGMWERRAPLSPPQVKQLLSDAPGSRVLIQPCTRRIFSNDEYRAAGAEVAEDISSANLLIGVKQVPKESLIPNKSYIFFSHTIKAQPYSMPLLDAVLEKQVRLYDYECITRDGRDDTPRLVAFGAYAGRAGMIDGLQGLGIRLLAEGFSTPFLNIPNTYMHDSLHHAHAAVKAVGKTILEKGLPTSLAPMVFAFTGTGNVAKGAREIFDLLPHEYVQPEDLPQLHRDVKAGLRPANRLYGVIVTASEMVRHKNPKQAFNKLDYYRQPQEHVATFHESILPFTTMLVNGMYWDSRFPRLITNDQLKSLRSKGNKSLKVVADISCDIDGGVQFLSKPTSIEQPYFTYVPERDLVVDNVSAAGVLMLGVDNLPTELPADASKHFGQRLLPFLPPLLRSTGSKDMDDIPPEMKRACLTSHGELMPKWQYIARLRDQAAVLTTTTTHETPSAHVRMEHSVRL
jgi:alpha-aminoadipic semialdehyde synthase